MSIVRSLNFGILIALVLLVPSVAAAMPQIIGDVETEFGIYSPYMADVVPNVPLYNIGRDLANVTNSERFEFTDNEKALLVQNGFVAMPGQFKQIHDLYNYCQDSGIPIFVTTDSMLHVYHILFDYTLRILETRKFYSDLERLNEVMLESAIAQYEAATDPRAKTAAKKNVAYFTVASVLLNPAVPIPPEVADLVSAELELIEAHAGGFSSPIFEYKEDYSQYVPRGHYTRNDELKKYFKSMMWYGRIAFRLKPREGEEKGKEETLQALLIVAAMKDAVIRGEPATDVWDRIYEPTVFFVGRTDDLNVYEYMELMTDIYGTDPGSLSPDALADDAKLERFISEASELRNPMINSSFVFETEDMEEITKGFRFMGQRFIPDSYMFQQLVHVAVTGRLFPKGLDVMAVLGSERAYDILVNVYNEDSYPKYSEQIEKLRGEFAGIDDEMWAQNLYWNWLYVLMPLLCGQDARAPGGGYPFFMQNQAWIDKELATALGSWAELRHDTILYAKQSYTFETAMPVGPQLVKGYVEPNPEFYARLASLAKFTREGLSGRGLLLPEFGHKFTQLEELLVSLKEISEIELEDNPVDSKAPSRSLSTEQYGLINNIGGTLEAITTFPPEIATEIEGQEDDEMAVIADVHTDPNTAQVLEEGVGYPLNIFVVVPVNGELRIAQGPMFSYYEFTQPMSNRLTDGQWQDILKTDPPDMPVWMDSFIDLAGIRKVEAHTSFEQRVAWHPTEINVSIKPELIEIGTNVEVNATIVGTLDSPLTVTLRQADTTIRSEMKEEPDSGFITAEYIAVLDTSEFRPGMAQIDVKGQLGEEEVSYTEELILERSSAVEGVSEVSAESGQKYGRGLQDRAYKSYPNPFNPDVWIPYELKRGTHVTIEVYNAVGQLIRTLDLGHKFPGRYVDAARAAHWDGRNSSGEQVSSGVYFYRLKAGDLVAVGKMIAVK
jgi:hypothetical protein